MVEPVDTTIPHERLRHPPEWHALWVHACIEMAPYGRRPNPHLIDRILARADRYWLSKRFDMIAAATVTRGGRPQANGRTMWITSMPHPATMSMHRVLVVLEGDDTEILTAYPV